MDKEMKLEALERMVAEGPATPKVAPHKAKCPNCGHEWTMGEEEYEEDDES